MILRRSTPLLGVLCALLSVAGCSATDETLLDGAPADEKDSGAPADGSTPHPTKDAATPAHDGGTGQVGDSGVVEPPGSETDAAKSGDDGGPPGGNPDILVPAQGALLGHYYGDGTIAQTDARIGRKPAIHLTYYGWDEDWTSDSVPKKDFTDGKIPLVNWEPGGINFDDIISGSLDTTIKARAAGSKAMTKKFFLDFAAEMNGDEGWGGNNPTKYIAAYRHIHDLFKAAGADNVVWAWCPNVADIDGSTSQTMSYYPGDAYVDWTGVDGYNWGTSKPGFGWDSFHDVFKDIYPKLAAKGKPILIGEMASDEVGGDKGKWIDGIIPTLRTDYPLIKGLVWFDIKKERQWQINSSPGSLAAFARMASDPFMNP